MPKPPNLNRNDPCPCGSGKKYKQCCQPADAQRARQTQAVQAALAEAVRAGLAQHRAGQLGAAEAIYREVLKLDPDYPDALHLLGVIASQSGQPALAVDYIGRAVAGNPANPNYHVNLGSAYKALGRSDAAAACYRRALALRPDAADGHNHLGGALMDLGQVAEAIASYRRALAIDPGHADAHCNLGTALKAQGQPDAALASFGRALAANPRHAVAHNNLGVLHKDQGRLAEAIASYRQALALQPDYADAHVNLANALQEMGELDAALAAYARALSIRETSEARQGFCACVRKLRFTHAEPLLRQLLVRALSLPWERPTHLAAAAISLLKADPALGAWIERANRAWPTRLGGAEVFAAEGFAAVAEDALLRCLLESAPACGLELERFLSSTRAALLDAALAGGELAAPVLAFACALARQCFLNEYVFAATDAELDDASRLRDALAAALAAGADVSPLALVAVAAYFPLASLAAAERLLAASWPEALVGLLAQQVREPEEERALRGEIAQLTRVEDEVSRRVRQQYEENPYPRWVKPAPAATPVSLDAHLARQFPHAALRPLGKGAELDVLIAGCGSGQHAIETCRQFLGARVLAVDLSLTSLAYAARKTRELGLANLTYAQADIMALGGLAQRFDLIESVGVLHHLGEPLAGARILRGLLRPGGFMRLGLYSECARQHVVAARQFIADHGFTASPADIRRCRQALLALDAAEPARQVASALDFWSLSECRDLLFHVEEHRFTLAEIASALDALGLDFVGFVLEAPVLRRYAACFPDDPAQTDLARWGRFEAENPQTFSGMYQFWAQARD